MKKITIVTSNDWQGLYADGKLLDEGHYVRLDDALRLLGHDVEGYEIDNEWMENEGGLPNDLKDVKIVE